VRARVLAAMQIDGDAGRNLADAVRNGRNMNEKNKISHHDAVIANCLANADDDIELGASVAGALAAERDMKIVELTEQAQEVVDLLHALDKIGDGIGGADGFAVSAVAIAARSVADNVYQYFKIKERT
jgi:hypothetical protein